MFRFGNTPQNIGVQEELPYVYYCRYAFFYKDDLSTNSIVLLSIELH